MTQIIQTQIKSFETERNIKILYACETGERAWDFDSKDSTYNVMFIYMNHPNWYMQTTIGYKDFEDTISYTDTRNKLCFNGWDFKKTINQFKKSDIQLLENLHSSIVYTDKHYISRFFTERYNNYFSKKATLSYYVRLAKKNFMEHILKNDAMLSDYLYVLRMILCCKWLEHRDGLPPINFNLMVHEFVETGKLRSEIDTLLTSKHNGSFYDTTNTLGLLQNYLDIQIMYYGRLIETMEYDVAPTNDTEMNDEFNHAFLSAVSAWNEF